MAQVYCITGDLEWYCQEFNFPYAMCDHPCPWCHADMHDEIPVFDFRTCAKWRKTIKSEAEMEMYEHPLFQVPGLNSQAIFLDPMHTVDLGVSMHVVGSVLWDLIEDKMEGSNRPARCVALNRLITQAYNDLGAPASDRVGVLKLTDIGDSTTEFPVLKHCKARKVRYLVPAVKRPGQKWHSIVQVQGWIATISLLFQALTS